MHEYSSAGEERVCERVEISLGFQQEFLRAGNIGAKLKQYEDSPWESRQLRAEGEWKQTLREEEKTARSRNIGQDGKLCTLVKGGYFNVHESTRYIK